MTSASRSASTPTVSPTTSNREPAQHVSGYVVEDDPGRADGRGDGAGDPPRGLTDGSRRESVEGLHLEQCDRAVAEL